MLLFAGIGMISISIIVGVIVYLYLYTNVFGNNEPVDGVMSEWENDGDCDCLKERDSNFERKPNGKGQKQIRKCIEPVNGGKECDPIEKEKSEQWIPCDSGDCSTWDTWVNADCTETCGNETYTRTRGCLEGAYDVKCAGSSKEEGISCGHDSCEKKLTFKLTGKKFGGWFPYVEMTLNGKFLKPKSSTSNALESCDSKCLFVVTNDEKEFSVVAKKGDSFKIHFENDSGSRNLVLKDMKFDSKTPEFVNNTGKQARNSTQITAIKDGKLSWGGWYEYKML